jgi:hypothetical protein
MSAPKADVEKSETPPFSLPEARTADVSCFTLEIFNAC